MLLRAPLPAEQKPWCGFAVAGLAVCWVTSETPAMLGVILRAAVHPACIQNSLGNPVRGPLHEQRAPS